MTNNTIERIIPPSAGSAETLAVVRTALYPHDPVSLLTYQGLETNPSEIRRRFGVENAILLGTIMLGATKPDKADQAELHILFDEVPMLVNNTYHASDERAWSHIMPVHSNQKLLIGRNCGALPSGLRNTLDVQGVADIHLELRYAPGISMLALSDLNTTFGTSVRRVLPHAGR